MADRERRSFNIVRESGTAIGRIDGPPTEYEALEAARVLLGYGGRVVTRFDGDSPTLRGATFVDPAGQQHVEELHVEELHPQALHGGEVRDG